MSNPISQAQKDIFAENLNRLLQKNHKTQADLVEHFKLTASTVSDWCNAKKYPRVDKVQMLADYFKVNKSDLTEPQKKPEEVLIELEKLFKTMVSDGSVTFRKVLPVFQSVELVNDSYSLKNFVTNTFVDNVDDFENHIALLVTNGDLEPSFNNQDIAIIHKQSQLENNKYFYLIVGKKISTIRKVIIDGDNIYLKADNPNIDIIFCKEDNIVVIGKVIVIQKNKKI